MESNQSGEQPLLFRDGDEQRISDAWDEFSASSSDLSKEACEAFILAALRLLNQERSLPTQN